MKYNVKCLLIAEHNDEKTKHYQLIFTNYLFREHKNIRFDGKRETSAFGGGLQVSIKGKDQKISELENKITQKDSKIDTLENKVTILESFKTEAISFISKISRLIPRLVAC